MRVFRLGADDDGHVGNALLGNVQHPAPLAQGVVPAFVVQLGLGNSVFNFNEQRRREDPLHLYLVRFFEVLEHGFTQRLRIKAQQVVPWLCVQHPVQVGQGIDAAPCHLDGLDVKKHRQRQGHPRHNEKHRQNDVIEGVVALFLFAAAALGLGDLLLSELLLTFLLCHGGVFSRFSRGRCLCLLSLPILGSRTGWSGQRFAPALRGTSIRRSASSRAPGCIIVVKRIRKRDGFGACCRPSAAGGRFFRRFLLSFFRRHQNSHPFRVSLPIQSYYTRLISAPKRQRFFSISS